VGSLQFFTRTTGGPVRHGTSVIYEHRLSIFLGVEMPLRR
jgi:hypothetical protein